MEWRIFFPSSEGLADVWTLLGQGKLSRHLLSSSEVRKDVYISCTEGVGLKIRGKHLMEIKVRGDKHPCGAEHWTKVYMHVHVGYRTHSSIPAQLLQKHTEIQSKEALQETFLRELRALLESHQSSLGTQACHQGHMP